MTVLGSAREPFLVSSTVGLVSRRFIEARSSVDASFQEFDASPSNDDPTSPIEGDALDMGAEYRNHDLVKLKFQEDNKFQREKVLRAYPPRHSVLTPPRYLVLTYGGTPCSPTMVLRVHSPKYSVLHPPRYSVLTHRGTPCVSHYVPH